MNDFASFAKIFVGSYFGKGIVNNNEFTLVWIFALISFTTLDFYYLIQAWLTVFNIPDMKL